jgi:hypothetical protein
LKETNVTNDTQEICFALRLLYKRRQTNFVILLNFS